MVSDSKIAPGRSRACPMNCCSGPRTARKSDLEHSRRPLWFSGAEESCLGLEPSHSCSRPVAGSSMGASCGRDSPASHAVINYQCASYTRRSPMCVVPLREITSPRAQPAVRGGPAIDSTTTRYVVTPALADRLEPCSPLYRCRKGGRTPTWADNRAGRPAAPRRVASVKHAAVW